MINLIIEILAAGLLLSLVAYVGVLAVTQANHFTQMKKTWDMERRVFQEEVKNIIDQRGFEQKTEEYAWSGFRKFMVRGKVLEGQGICSFYLAPHDGQALPPFMPGQYLTFRLDIPGSPAPVVRCYSLSDSPNHSDYYRVTIKQIPPPHDQPDAPGGLVSSYFHGQLEVDDIVDVKAPAGKFFLDVRHYHGPVVLVAGGIGLTPVLSMLNTIVELGSTRETWFFCGVRNKGENIMREQLRRIAGENENVHLHICYSEPGDDDAEGEDYDHAERISVDMFKRLLPSNNYDFYICGPPPMMQSITEGLHDWGVPKARVHFELFGTASVKKVARTQPAPAGEEAIEVTFAKSEITCKWDPAAFSLLELAEANGVAIDFGCRAGNCGTCITAIRSGEIEYLSEPGARVEEGSCLACIAVPRGDVALDA